MALSEKQIKDICCYGCGSMECRYLDDDVNDSSKSVWVCRKKTTDKDIIDLEVKEFIDTALSLGIDPDSEDQPIGDNCPGYILLKNKIQGYDVK